MSLIIPGGSRPPSILLQITALFLCCVHWLGTTPYHRTNYLVALRRIGDPFMFQEQRGGRNPYPWINGYMMTLKPAKRIRTS